MILFGIASLFGVGVGAALSWVLYTAGLQSYLALGLAAYVISYVLGVLFLLRRSEQ